MCYGAPITDDVLSNLNPERVNEALKVISQLKMKRDERRRVTPAEPGAER